MINQWCLAHSFHLAAKFQLKFLYGGKYFAALAKIVNVWRCRGNPQKVKQGLRGCL